MDVKELSRIMAAAKYPEDVFGELAGTTLKAVYRMLAKALHPDRNPGETATATAAFRQLTAWYDQAEAKMRAGTYGDRGASCAGTVVASAKDEYTLVRRLEDGDLCDVYLANAAKAGQVVLKVVRTPANGDLVRAEAATLNYLHSGWEGAALKAMQHIPKVLDSFRIKSGSATRFANVMPYSPGITLAEAEQAYAANLEYVDPRDLAWMVNRMLGALVACHQAGYVHCCITPDHVYLHPDTHGGQLLDWSYAVKAGAPPKAIVPAWRSMFPHEFWHADKSKRRPATFGADLYMLAKCVMYVTEDGARLPKPYAGLFRACLLGHGHRPQDSYEFFDEFQQVLKNLYGPPKFRKFELPAKPKTTTTRG